MKHVLSLSTLYPNAVNPRFGAFVARSLEALAKLGAARGDWRVTVVNPIGLPPIPLGRYRSLSQLDAQSEENNIVIHRPRFTLIPALGARRNASAIAKAALPLVERIHAETPIDLIDAQFFVGMPDSEVEKLLNFFTFLPQEKIAETMRQHVGAPEKRVAQHLLAREFVELVHGVEDAEAAQRQHMDRSKASSTDDSIQMPSSQVIGADYASLLKHAGLVESRSKGVALISSGGAYRIMEDGSAMKILKAETVALEHLSQEGNDATKFLTLRAGKWKTRTISLGNGD